MKLTDEMTRTHWLVRAAARDGMEPHQRLQAARAAAEEQRTMSDLQERADKVQEELTRLWNLARGWGWPDDSDELRSMLINNESAACEAAQILSAAEAALSDASALISALCVELAGLRARLEVRK